LAAWERWERVLGRAAELGRKSLRVLWLLGDWAFGRRDAAARSYSGSCLCTRARSVESTMVLCCET